ncbi:MAG: SIR2 family protein [Saprospiraceae bacterium]|jgi:hypothetical protein|nr:SIR2 family protein [Saprospiraceae bacterium]
MSKLHEPLPDFNWQTLLEKLRMPQTQCALVLGEGAFADGSGKLLRDLFREHLEKSAYSKYLISSSVEDSLLMLPDAERTDFCSAARPFYQGQPVADALRRLVEIPFPLIINTTPHTQLAKAFDGTGAVPQYCFYNRSEISTGKIQPPGRGTPLVYNLLGSIEDDNSLVLTHSNLFDYFEAIFHERPLPEELRLLLQGIRYFVFLGVPFGQWYFHLLLRILHIHNFTTANRHASAEGVNDADINFVGELFQIRFVQKNIGSFVDELHQRCSEENLLRTGVTQPNSFVEAVKTHLHTDDPNGNGLVQALEMLESFLSDKGDENLLNELMILSGNFRRTGRKYDGKLITHEQFETELNRSKVALLNFLEDVKSRHETAPLKSNTN